MPRTLASTPPFPVRPLYALARTPSATVSLWYTAGPPTAPAVPCPRIWNRRYSLGRKRNNGDCSTSQTGMRVRPRHKGSGYNSLINRGVTDITNEGAIKWGGRRLHKLLLPALYK